MKHYNREGAWLGGNGAGVETGRNIQASFELAGSGADSSVATAPQSSNWTTYPNIYVDGFCSLKHIHSEADLLLL